MLHALRNYGSALGGEPGFTTSEVRWRIDLGPDGRLLGVLPLGDGKKGRPLDRCPDMHGMNAGGRSHFLIEAASYIALLCSTKDDDKKLAATHGRHLYYRELLKAAAADVELLAPLCAMLGDGERLREIREALAAQKAKPTDWVEWRIGGADPRVDPLVQDWWRRWRQKALTSQEQIAPAGNATVEMVCVLSGAPTRPLATHPKIGGLGGVGGLAMGDVLVGCDKGAFTSYGLDQAANAAMSAVAAQHYIDGLNDLVRSHSRKLAGALVIHWFRDRVPATDDPFAYLYGFESEEEVAKSAQAEARRLLDSIRSGQRQDLAENRFYALTLSGAAGRVMVRDWMEHRFERLAENIHAWFSDLAIVARDGKALAREPKFLAVCGALVADRGDLNDLPASAASALWRVAIAKGPVPTAFLAQTLSRFRAALFKDEPMNHARMGLLKAYFVRSNRGDASKMKSHLNPDHPDPAYHCGRLLAVLAGLQRSALGDVGAGVVQRYYPAMSQMPGLTLGRLIGNARNHLNKIEGGLPWWYEGEIADIMGRIGDHAPRTLDLEGQGLFALGYYQQIAALRAGSKADDKPEQPGETT
jgi:CRISPR-associated protein Csd1